jgi:SRSO17 transposase
MVSTWGGRRWRWKRSSGSKRPYESSMPSSPQPFGRNQWREHSRHYLQALLFRSQERRNAENLAELVPVSARALQRFLTEARWDDSVVMARLQVYLGPRMAHPLAVWVDGSDFSKQGVKSVEVAQ